MIFYPQNVVEENTYIKYLKLGGGEEGDSETKQNQKLKSLWLKWKTMIGD